VRVRCRRFEYASEGKSRDDSARGWTRGRVRYSAIQCGNSVEETLQWQRQAHASLMPYSGPRSPLMPSPWHPAPQPVHGGLCQDVVAEKVSMSDEVDMLREKMACREV